MALRALGASCLDSALLSCWLLVATTQGHIASATDEHPAQCMNTVKELFFDLPSSTQGSKSNPLLGSNRPGPNMSMAS